MLTTRHVSPNFVYFAPERDPYFAWYLKNCGSSSSHDQATQLKKERPPLCQAGQNMGVSCFVSSVNSPPLPSEVVGSVSLPSTDFTTVSLSHHKSRVVTVLNHFPRGALGVGNFTSIDSSVAPKQQKARWRIVWGLSSRMPSSFRNRSKLM